MDDATSEARLSAPRCTWCSAELPDADAAVCPSCGATLTGEGDAQIPGVTALTSPTSSRLSSPPKRSRLLQWISGEPGDDVNAPQPAPGSLAPPDDDVRREIRRLELEAQLTNLSAEASAIAADDALEARAANDLVGAEAALKVARDARTVTEALDAGTLDAIGLADGGRSADTKPADTKPAHDESGVDEAADDESGVDEAADDESGMAAGPA
jgi:hypothetical protein